MLPLFLFMHMVFFHIGRSYAILSTHVSTRKDLGGGVRLSGDSVFATLSSRNSIEFDHVGLPLSPSERPPSITMY